MARTQKIYESQLYEVWKKRQFGNVLKTVSGDCVSVIDVGVQDLNSSGPDFKNARVRIGNLTFVGDIEIDSDYKDWKLHGHNIDCKYNKVILHASLYNKFNQPYVYTKEGRKVPTLCLDEFITVNLQPQSDDDISTEDGINSLKCAYDIDRVSDEEKEILITELGIQRFKKKCTKIHQRLKEITYLKELKIAEPVLCYDLPSEFEERIFENKQFEDREIWEQVFYELAFEALGYTKNKCIMQKIAQSAHISFIKGLKGSSDFLSRIEATLLGIAGMLNGNVQENGEKVTAYVSSMLTDWENIKRTYDGRTFDEADWHFFKMHPQNFPTIRLAGGARLLVNIIDHNLIGRMSTKFTQIKEFTALINSLRSLFIIRADGFWAQHYVFNKESEHELKYFIGASRADEIVVNVIFPFFAVYFEIFGKEKICRKIYQLYSQYNQKSDNRIIRDVADGLKMKYCSKRTIISQGMIELFRAYCSRNRCLECPIGKNIFS